MKNIAIMIGCLHGGGAERIAGLLSKRLSRKYNVYLFLTNTDNIVYEYEGTIVNLAINGNEFIKYYAAEYKKKYEIDCAISFLEGMNFINIQTKGKEKVIISERCTPSRQYFAYDYPSQCIKRLYNYADKIVSVSQGVEYDLIERFHIKKDSVTTIYNFVDKDIVYRKLNMELAKDVSDFAGDSKIVLNIGRLAVEKKQKKLLVQFSKLLSEGEDAKLIIVGSGGLYKQLCELVHSLGIGKYVKIINYMNNPFPCHKIATIFALTSDSEGLPNVILEAMVCGTPIVAVDCMSGPRELLKESSDYKDKITGIEICKNGILVEQADSDTTGRTEYFKNAMKILLHDEHLRNTMASNAKRYMENYSNEKIGNDWIKVIEENTYSSSEKVPEVADGVLTAKKIIIYGAGVVGRLVMLPYLNKEKEYDLLCFAVSGREGNAESIYGIPVFEIEQLLEYRDDAVVLIGVSEKFQQEVTDMVEDYGFKHIAYPVYQQRDYVYYCETDECHYKEEVSKWYMEKTDKRFEWNNLNTYNEKLQWLKLYDCTKEKRMLSDRYQVRAYVEERIGEQYLIPLYGCWDSFEQIDFDSLPEQFVLKCTHGPKWSLIVEDKELLNMAKIKEQFESWMMLDYAYISGFSMNYRGIVPRIIAEEKIKEPDNEELNEYGIYVFDGKVKIVQPDCGKNSDFKSNLYTKDWEELLDGMEYPTASDIRIEKPRHLGKMIELSEELGRGFRHVRVDFYFNGSRIYFNKMNFIPENGIGKFTSKKLEKQMGSWILLPQGL